MLLKYTIPTEIFSPAQSDSSGAPGGPTTSTERVTGQCSQRAGSQLRLRSAGTGSQDGPPGMATKQNKCRMETSPADAAVLKEVGLTSDDESGGNAWGSSGEENCLQQDANEEQGPTIQSLGEAPCARTRGHEITAVLRASTECSAGPAPVT